jgi:hypothetical protein
MKIVDNLKTKAKTFYATQEEVLVVVMMFVAMARFIVTMMFIETFLNHEELF